MLESRSNKVVRTALRESGSLLDRLAEHADSHSATSPETTGASGELVSAVRALADAVRMLDAHEDERHEDVMERLAELHHDMSTRTVRDTNRAIRQRRPMTFKASSKPLF